LALGCYLIDAQPEGAGPLVLFAPYSPQHLLKEYANEEAFIKAFTTPAPSRTGS
jgi:hypothetical protein